MRGIEWSSVMNLEGQLAENSDEFLEFLGDYLKIKCEKKRARVLQIVLEVGNAEALGQARHTDSQSLESRTLNKLGLGLPTI